MPFDIDAGIGVCWATAMAWRGPFPIRRWWLATAEAAWLSTFQMTEAAVEWLDNLVECGAAVD